MDQGPQPKTRHTKSNRRKVEKSIKFIGVRGNFLNRTQIVQALRSRIGKWGLMKQKSFCKAKDIVNRTNWKTIDWEKFFTNLISERGLIFKIYEKLKKLTSKNTNKPNQKMGYRPKQRIHKRAHSNG